MMSQTSIEGYQLSPQQKRFWLLKQKMHPTFSHAHCILLLRGDLDITALHTALQQVIERHEILRTAFQNMPGMGVPLQVIQNATENWQDYMNIPQMEGDHSQYAIEITQPCIEHFMTMEPTIDQAQAKLYMIDKDSHILFLAMPGLWIDQQGIASLAREVMGSYGNGDQFMPEPIQYTAVAQWLNELLDMQENQEEITGHAYWRERLAIERPRIPFAHSSTDTMHFHPQRTRSTIAPRVAEKLNTITHGSDTSLKAFMLTCFNLLLWRLTGIEDSIIGTACDGRTEEDLDTIPGLLTRYVPILTHLSPEQHYTHIWQQVTHALQEAEELQEYFDWNISEQTHDNEHGANYFPAVFHFQNWSHEYQTKNVTCTIADSLTYSDIFDLQLTCTQTKTGCTIDFHYNETVLSQADTERFTAYFARLLEEVTTNVEADIASYEILDTPERQTLLHDFASGEQVEIEQGWLIASFEEQVRLTPDNFALYIQGDELTYRELNARSNKVAHLLQRMGVQQQTTVALCTERSVDSLVGLLGILKVGGIYVPLDPAYPEERQKFILQDSQVSVIVTQKKLCKTLEHYAIKIACIDAGLDQEGDEDNLAMIMYPEQTAYIIYTSGSTGQPKGAELSHRAILNHVHTIQREFHLTEHDRVLQFASLSFDVSLEQIFPTLLSGAALIMRGPTLWSGAELNKAIVEQKLTVINLTPAFWQQWMAELHATPTVINNNQVRLVIIGGEAMTLEAVRSWHQTPLAACSLLNAYGPTEAVITATIFNIPQHIETDNGARSMPIGRPLANREVYILNKQRKLVPIGLVGELYLGGEILATGYLKRPELTTKHFISDPFKPGTHAHLYRTGDLARFLPDGSIEYVGRVDQQVKIRGFRIELGEIEAQLQDHPEVQTAIVEPQIENNAEKRLVAYMLHQHAHPPTIASIRHFLETRLPEYMIPSTFIWLDTLPLTTNGKVDRRALPTPDTTRPDLDEAFIAPRNTIEEQLAHIWSEVLGVNEIGIHDNFFKLGGHSLSATQVIARIRSTFRVNLPVYLLFQEPTIARLAEKVKREQEESTQPVLPTVTCAQRRHNIGDSAVPTERGQE